MTLVAVGSRLPEYRVKAVNHEPDSANLLHNEEYARRYGFCGKVVPSVSVYAFLSRSLVEFYGEDWLERGSAEFCVTHPVYDGEDIRVSGCVSGVGRDGTISVYCKAANCQAMDCGIVVAALPPGSRGAEPRPDEYPCGSGTARRPISLDLLTPGDPLVPVTSEFTRTTHWEYCQKAIKDHHPVYLHRLHPGWLASQANCILTANYDLTAWIHVSSSIQKYRSLQDECVVETRGRVHDSYENKGNHFVVLDVALFSRGCCLETILHTVIFRIAPHAA